MSVVVPVQQPTWRRAWLFFIPLTLLFGVWLASGLGVPAGLTARSAQFQGLVTTFLGIFIEALPFLLAGVIASVAIQQWITPQRLATFVPRSTFGATLMGSMLGFLFPVCECGAIPASRRLLRKGAPAGLGISFALAAPVVNPVVFVSTMVAFGDWRWAFGRVGLTIIIALTIGLLLSIGFARERILAPAALVDADHNHVHGPACDHDHHEDSTLRSMLAHGTVEFFEMVQYLIIGGLLAATMQTFIPQSVLLSLSEGGALGILGPVVAIVVLMLVAVVLSVCSTVDAFLALSFVGLFHPGAIMAFLVFGPMIDIKSGLMLLSTFRKPTVLAMIILAFQFSLLVGLITYLVL